ncbi:MAG: DMT family transporter [Nitrososphaerota archaeon]
MGKLFRIEYLYLTAAGILWGSGHPVIRYILGAGDRHMNSLHIAFLSTCIGMVMLVMVMTPSHRLSSLWKLGRRGLAIAGAAGGLQYGLYPILSYTALSFIPASLNAIIVGSSPILIALLSRALLDERLRLVSYAGIALAFTGLVLLVGGYGGGPVSVVGTSLSALGALVASLYAVAGRYLMRSYDALSISLLGALIGSLLLAYVTYAVSGLDGIMTSSPTDLALVAYWGVAVTTGNLLFYLSLKRMKAVGAGAFFFVSPVAAATLSIIFLGEPLTATVVLGMAAALVGVRLTQLGIAK